MISSLRHIGFHNCGSISWASSISSYVIEGLQINRQAFTDSIQLKKRSRGRTLKRRNGEYTRHQLFHSAVCIEAKPIAILPLDKESISGGIRMPAVDFSMAASACGVNIPSSIHSLTLRFAVPKKRLCIGSMTVHRTTSKYSKRCSSDQRVPVSLTRSFCSSSVFAANHLFASLIFSQRLLGIQAVSSKPEYFSCLVPGKT